MTARPITIRSMLTTDAPRVAALADRLVGVDYYPPSLVLEYIERATIASPDLPGAVTTAYVAERGDTLLAFRFVIPPGRWLEGRGRGQTPDGWPGGPQSAAYFQSCFVDHDCMGQGIGGRLAARGLADLRSLGARAVVAHSWKESPHNSSFRYLTRLGFEPIAEHVEYWREVDYRCIRCGRPCVCTAIEMVLDLREPPH